MKGKPILRARMSCGPIAHAHVITAAQSAGATKKVYKSYLLSVELEEYYFSTGHCSTCLPLPQDELTRKTNQVGQGGKFAGSSQVAGTGRADHERQGIDMHAALHHMNQVLKS